MVRGDSSEFLISLSRMGMTLDRAAARKEFDSIDSNAGELILFDEFSEWLVRQNQHKFQMHMRGQEWASAHPDPLPFKPVDLVRQSSYHGHATIAAHDRHVSHSYQPLDMSTCTLTYPRGCLFPDGFVHFPCFSVASLAFFRFSSW
jgi:hypothetical protein